MAIWQHTWLVVPITSDFDSRYRVFNEQAATEFLRESDIFWRETDTKFHTIAHKIDSILPRANYSSAKNLCWKSYIDSMADNDCNLFLEGECIREFQFRIDVRDALNIRRLTTFLISLCEEYDFTLINLKYQLVRPEIENITTDILQSNAVSFLQDPILFLDKLSNEK